MAQGAAVVLLNPAAGGGRAEGLRAPVQRWLARHAPGVPLLAPDNAEAARATLMVMAPRTRVVLVGGDGTVHHMLPALMRCGHRLGLLPAGRENRLAAAVGLWALGWEEALRYALHAQAQAIDVAQVDADQVSTLFVTRLAAGHDALLAQLRARHAQWLGGERLGARIARLRAGLQSQPTDLRLWINGRLQHDAQALGVVVANTPDERMRLPVHLADTCFETRVRPTTGRTALMWARSAPLALGDEASAPLQWGGAGKILVDAARPLPLVADGETLPRLARFSIRCLPRALFVAGRTDLVSA